MSTGRSQRRARRSAAGRRRRARSGSTCCSRFQAEYAKRQAEIGDAIIEEMGAPASLAHGFHVGLGAGHLQTAIEVLQRIQVRRGAWRDDHRARADRRLRADHAVELADEPDLREDLPGARHRLHDDPQAAAARAFLGADPRRGAARRGRAGGRVQHDPGIGQRDRDGAVDSSRRRHGLVHRVRDGRRADPEGRRRHGQARRARARRQEPVHRAR